MMKPLSSLLMRLLHAVHGTRNASELTLLSHCGVNSNFMSIQRWTAWCRCMNWQREVWLRWLLLIVLRGRLLLMKKLIYIVDIIIQIGPMSWLRNCFHNWCVWGWLMLDHTFQSDVINVRRFIWVSSNIVVRFILMFDVRVDSHHLFLVLLLVLLLFTPTLWWLSAVEIIILFLDRLLSHLSYSGPDLLLLLGWSLSTLDA